MVKTLVNGGDVSKVAFDVSAFDATHGAIKVTDVLKSVKARLIELSKNPSFWPIIE